MLETVRIHCQRKFHQFGIHCATHQIRVIIICAIVITSLFYPALALYSSSRTQPFVSSNSQNDLQDIWSGYENLRIRGNALTRARCGVERTLRVERLFIQSPKSQSDGALNRQILTSTLDLENRIQAALAERNVDCLNRSSGTCFVLSPLLFWNYESTAIDADEAVFDTLSLSRNITADGIPITPHMVLAGRDLNDDGDKMFDAVQFLALTYFFPTTDCLGNSEATAWRELVEAVAGPETELSFRSVEPVLTALELTPEPTWGFPLPPVDTFLWFAYSVFAAYVSWSMKHMTAVHSRLGVTFTALVEIVVSTITSLSACALVGFKITMVPLELLPISILFVGAENMFNLVDAVGKTSVTLPVKQRIADGLSKAGTSNTLKVVSYNAILGAIAACSSGAIRQFCAYAVVLLVAHWFLAHTFFITVLSVDLQRLELSEVIRQNPKEKTAPAGVQNFWAGRAVKNLSLLLFLSITATLYFTTNPRGPADPAPLRALSRTPLPPTGSHAPEQAIWKLMNPSGDPVVHLRLETPVVLSVGRRAASGKRERKGGGARYVRFKRWAKAMKSVLKIVLVPMSMSIGSLYGLLLYLLKDADLLEAQRNRPGGVDSGGTGGRDAEESGLEGRLGLRMLRRLFAADVELLASSANGAVVLAVSVRNEVGVWRLGRGRRAFGVDVADFLTRVGTGAGIAAACVDEKGLFCALGSAVGIVAVWVLGEDEARALLFLEPEETPAPVSELRFISPEGARLPELLVVYQNGVVLRWTLGKTPSRMCVRPSAGSPTATLLDLPEGVLVAFASEDGSLELVDTRSSRSVFRSDPATINDDSTKISRVHACYIDFSGTSRTLVIGTATESGVICLWDGATGERFSRLEETFGEVGQLRVSALSREPCVRCGGLPLEGFLLSFSVGQVVVFYRAAVNERSTRRCVCAALPPARLPESNLPSLPSTVSSVVGRRSRRNSASGSSVVLGRKASNPLFDRAASFPVSGHGVRSRRASEKETNQSRRSLELLTTPFSIEEIDGRVVSSLRVVDSLPASPVEGSARLESVWRDVGLTRVGAGTCERGGWDVMGEWGVGVRRRSRGFRAHARPLSSRESAPGGLSSGALERWECWAFDPCRARFRVSVLSALASLDGSEVSSSAENEGDASGKPPFSSSLPNVQNHSRRKAERFTRLPFTRVSPLVFDGELGLVGLGNTVGLFKAVDL